MAQTIDWTATEARAKRMGLAQLRYALSDCQHAARVVPEDAIGKDAGYYRDEASVYFRELSRRDAV